MLNCFLSIRWRRALQLFQLLIEVSAFSLVGGTDARSQAADGIPSPEYTVATVKESTDDTFWKFAGTPDGMEAHGLTLKYLIEEAYGIYDDTRILGGPEWLGRKRFDIRAKVSDPPAREFTANERRAMLQRLLKQRFDVILHTEERETSVYLLAEAKNGAHLTPSMHHSIPETSSNVRCLVKGNTRPGQMSATDCTLTELANILQPSLGRPILDRTNLSGTYDFELHWNPDELKDSDEPTIWAAMKEQLGLQLLPGKAPLPALVLDHADLPSEN
jgi:uncharacterized protein (TIGR03435 family)